MSNPVHPRVQPRANPLAAVLVVIAALGLFVAMDALMKQASQATGVFAALLGRSVIGTAVLWPAWRWMERRGTRAAAWPGRAALRLHALRGTIMAGMAGSYFWGLVRTPLAEAIAISFVAPLFALYLAAAVLGERVRREAVAGSAIALAGVAVIAGGRLRDAGAGGEAALGIAAILGSAALYAWNLVLQRRQAQMAGPLEIATFQNLFGALAMAAAVPVAVLAGAEPGAPNTVWNVVIPAAAALPAIAWSALLVSVSLMLLAWAYARAEAQVLVPVEYAAFPWSALAGWLWFAEPVTGATLAGLALIVPGVWIGARGAPQPQAPPARTHA